MNIEFLDNFIKQSKTSNLRTKGYYPESIFEMDLKVSFGMGTPTHVPWISALGPGMTTSNGYYPVYLFYKNLNVLILAYGISETVSYEEPWNREIVQNNKMIKEVIENPFRYGESFVFKKYDIQEDEEEIKYLIDGSDVSKEQLLQDLQAIVLSYRECLDITVKDTSSDLSKGLFYMESQLEDFIIQNWEESELGKKYDLIYEDGDLKSQQYLTDIGKIDILAKDKNDGSYIVIELKRNQTSDDTVGQVTRYMGWVEDKLGGGNIKGIIIAGKYDEKLYYAQKMLPNIEVFLYEVNFKLNEYKK